MRANIPQSLTKRERDTVKQMKKDISVTLDCAMMINLLALNSEFGFGEERLDRFVKAWQKASDKYCDRYDDYTYDALKRDVKAMGIEFETK